MGSTTTRFPNGLIEIDILASFLRNLENIDTLHAEELALVAQEC
jgi:hypothetical protein